MACMNEPHLQSVLVLNQCMDFDQTAKNTFLGRGKEAFSWAQIGRSAIFGREIGVPDREIFSWQKYSILVSKIVICSTVDHCKMF